MNKKYLLAFAPFLVMASIGLTACDGGNSANKVLRILNAEDYIYEYADGDEFDLDVEKDDTMLEMFRTYWSETYGEEIDIVYDTYDTNETMFNGLKTGKTTYDVIIPSDYMVQKLANTVSDKTHRRMIRPLENKNLYDNISTYMEESLRTIKINDYMLVDENVTDASSFDDELAIYGDLFVKKLNTETNKYEYVNVNSFTNGETYYYNASDVDFCVPYMWGTLGIMYNPNYYLNSAELGGYFNDIDDVHDAFSSWDGLYQENVANSFSIKDSVRDTYTACLIHYYDDENKSVVNGKSVKECVDEKELHDVINANDSDTVANVKMDIETLKNNAFGFETDSGKLDMTTEKIGANFCWSGDATWAITEAEDNGLELYYSLPIGDSFDPEDEKKSGSNIWFDCFCCPDNYADPENPTQAEKDQVELAEEFIAFMSQPENAMMNCFCVGYTPAVAGDEMLDYMRSCYDVRQIIEDYEDTLSTLSDDLNAMEDEELIAYCDYYGYCIDEDTEAFFEEEGHPIEFNEPNFFEKIGLFFQGIVDMDALYLEQVVSEEKATLVDYIVSCVQAEHDDLSYAYDAYVDNGHEAHEDYKDAFEEYDLSYFFNDIEEDDKLIVDSTTAMRQLRAQYPRKEDLSRLAIMEDFGEEGNQRILDMWEQVRTNPLPEWGWIVMIIEIVAGLGFGAYLLTNKVIRKKLKKARA